MFCKIYFLIVLEKDVGNENKSLQKKKKTEDGCKFKWHVM